MTLQQLVDGVKRDARTGTVGNNTDQAAQDIIRFLNNRRFEVWRAHPWDWSIVDISLTVTTTSYDKTLASTVGEIIALWIDGQTGRLKRYGMREYHDWERNANVGTDNNPVVGYVHLGRDSSLNIKVRFFDAPVTDTTVLGWGKKRISAYVLADIATVTTLEYFPEEIQDVLFRFVLADMFAQISDLRAEATLRNAYKNMRVMIGDKESEADTEQVCPPPDYLRFVNRRRGRGTGVW